MDVSAPQLRQITAYLCELLQHVIYGRAELIARFCMLHSPGETYIHLSNRVEERSQLNLTQEAYITKRYIVL